MHKTRKAQDLLRQADEYLDAAERERSRGNKKGAAIASLMARRRLLIVFGHGMTESSS